MTDEKPQDDVAAQSPLTRLTGYPPLYWAGFALMIFGVTFTTMNVMNHLKQQPRQPLLFDLTLRRGDGGFIFYGALAAILGFTLILASARLRKAK